MGTGWTVLGNSVIRTFKRSDRIPESILPRCPTLPAMGSGLAPSEQRPDQNGGEKHRVGTVQGSTMGAFSSPPSSSWVFLVPGWVT